MIVFNETELDGFTGQVWQLDPQVWVGDVNDALCDITDFYNPFATTADEYLSLCKRFDPRNLWDTYSNDIISWIHREFDENEYRACGISVELGVCVDDYQDGGRVTDGGLEYVSSFLYDGDI